MFSPCLISAICQHTIPQVMPMHQHFNWQPLAGSLKRIQNLVFPVTKKQEGSTSQLPCNQEINLGIVLSPEKPPPPAVSPNHVKFLRFCRKKNSENKELPRSTQLGCRISSFKARLTNQQHCWVIKCF